MYPQAGMPFSRLLTFLEKETPVIHPEYKLSEKAKDSGFDSLFIPHYSTIANRIITDVISNYLSRDKLDKNQEYP